MDKNNGIVRYTIFAPFKSLLAFSTTKKLLDNPVPRFTGDSPEIFLPNRAQLANILGIKTNQLVFPRQTHTNSVADLSGLPENEIKDTDALITNQPGICLCVQTADCVPVLLFDPKEKVISVVHAGWRGTVKRIAEEAVQKMISKYGSSAENILALIGPSIGPEVYEVGDEVVRQVHRNIPGAEKTLMKGKNEKFHFNLWKANRNILLDSGLMPENIQIAGECSFSENEKYFSARRDGAETGRIVSGIMMIPTVNSGFGNTY